MKKRDEQPWGRYEGPGNLPFWSDQPAVPAAVRCFVCVVVIMVVVVVVVLVVVVAMSGYEPKSNTRTRNKKNKAL